MMKRLILAAAMLTAATAASAQTARPVYLPAGYGQTVAGDLSLAVGRLEISGTGLNLFNTNGRANLAIGSSWNVEIEANAQAYSIAGVSALPMFIDGYAHVWNGTGTVAWGAFGGASHQLGLLVSSVGGEFKAFMGNLSVGGAVAMTSFSSATGWTVNASANAYVTSNDRVGISGAWMNVGGGSVWEVTAEVEHRFAQPASLWLSASTMNNSAGTAAMWSLLAGFRVYLDAAGSTQQSHEAQVPFRYRLPVMLGP